MKFSPAAILVALIAATESISVIDAFAGYSACGFGGHRTSLMNKKATSHSSMTFLVGKTSVSTLSPMMLKMSSSAKTSENTEQELQSEDQMLHTAERVAGMSRGEIQHIFEDVDADSSGAIDMVELDQLLIKYFGEILSRDEKEKLMQEIDLDGNGTIDADEFYQWMVLNAKSEGTIDEKGTKALQKRQERLRITDQVPEDLIEMLDELGTGAVVQKVTHPLHSAFGRTLRDHFLSCYLLAREWGNPDHVCVASLFHALYQRGDGMRAVDFTEYRPLLQEKLGEDVEELIYLFPSAHKSVLLEDGLLMAPIVKVDDGEEIGDIQVPNVLEGGMVTIPGRCRAGLVELEVINSHDQNVLENSNSVHNLWSFYVHAPALSLMSPSARETIGEFMVKAPGATCGDILEWHEQRFNDANQEMPDLWKKHLELFRKGGKFFCAEEQMQVLADENDDGEIDWEEFTTFDWDTCFISE